jgi:hypothetical protein
MKVNVLERVMAAEVLVYVDELYQCRSSAGRSLCG